MMAYTGTTNYGFQKPAKENAFTVDDLNHALDKIDETIKNLSDEVANAGTGIIFDAVFPQGTTYNLQKSDGLPISTGAWSTPLDFKLAKGNYKIIINTIGKSIEYPFEVMDLPITDDMTSVFSKVTFNNLPKNVTVISDSTTLFTSSATNISITLPKDKYTFSFTVNNQYSTGEKLYSISSITANCDMSNINLDLSISITTLLITSNISNFSVPTDDEYEIFVIGGGGSAVYEDNSYWGSCGGAGGSGEMHLEKLKLTAGEPYNLIIGNGSTSASAGGITSFGNLLSASGGASAHDEYGADGGAGGGGGYYQTGRYSYTYGRKGGNGQFGGGGGGHGGAASRDQSTSATGAGGNGGTYGGGGGGGGLQNKIASGGKAGTYGGKGGSGGQNGSAGIDTSGISGLLFTGTGKGGSRGSETSGGGGGGGYGGNGGNGNTYGSGGGGGGYGANGGNAGTGSVGAGGGGGYGGNGGNGHNASGGGGGYGKYPASTLQNAGYSGEGYGAGAGGSTGTTRNNGVNGCIVVRVVL